MEKTARIPRKPALLLVGALGLAACEPDGTFDIDFRDTFGSRADTTAAIRSIQTRPDPDANGVISYPTYQVAVARRGDTIQTVAARVGLPADEVAQLNGVPPETALRDGEIVALPGGGTGTAGQTDLAGLAGAAIDRSPEDAPRKAPEVSETALSPAGPEPVRHRVARGETAFSIARLYDVPVSALAEWNGLGPELTVREGQFLLVPVVLEESAAAAAPVTVPGEGTATPTPPSAALPQPSEDETPVAEAPPAPNNTEIGAEATRAATAMSYPVQGDIIRAYAKGRNEGIDIAAPAGTPVVAAEAGTVAAISEDTNGISILVIKHANNLLTVYTNIDALTVEKGDTVTRDQKIAEVRAADQPFVHFEIRDGLNSVDPSRYLDS